MKRSLLIAFLLLVTLGLIFWIYEKRLENDPNHITLYGNVDVRQVNLGFRVSGRVASMPFQEGDWVEAGTLMANLEPQPYRDLVLQAEATLAGIQANLFNSERLLKRRDELKGDGGVSDEEFQNAENSRDVLEASKKQSEASLGVAYTNLKDTRIIAPSTGTILTRVREPGTIVKEGDPVYTLSLIDPVWIRAYVSETDLGNIYPNMKAEVKTDSGRTYQGHIGFISPVAEFTPKTVETTQLRVDLVYRLRIIADNPDRYLKQGMPVTVKLIRDDQHDHQPQRTVSNEQ